MLSAILEAIAAFFAAWLSGRRKQEQQQEADHAALTESQDDAKAFAAPDRSKSDVINAFRMHRDGDR